MKLELIRSGSFALVALAAILDTGAANAQTFKMVPTISLTESRTDNAALLPSPLAQSAWVTDLSPGIRADLLGARVKGYIDFRLQSSYYSTASRFEGVQRFLSSYGKVEAVEKLFFAEARAGISQQNRSPFGAAVIPDASSPSANRVETTAYQVSPYVRGDYRDFASYQLRYIETHASADDPTLPDTRTSEWVAKVGNATRSAKLGWTIEANALRLRNDVVGTLENNRARGSLIYAVNPQLHVAAYEGYETTDFTGPRQSNDTPGVGLDWSPSVRTQLSAVYEKRFFGDGYNVVFRHRTPWTVWRFASIRDAVSLPTQLVTSNLNSTATLLAELLTSAIPDPEERAKAAKSRLEEYGFPGSSALSSDVLTSRPFVFKSSIASVALLGATNTVSLTVSSREQRAFGVGLSGPDFGVPDDFRQTGFDATFGHKLTPLTSLTLSATRLQTDGLGANTRHTRQESYRLSVTSKIGPNSTAIFGVQHIDFNSSVVLESYRENRIFGTVSLRL